MGWVTLEPRGGQVPWHNQEQEEVYLVVRGAGEMCLGEERSDLSTGQAVYIPPKIFHQLTNTGDEPLIMMYCYAPAGEVAHWKQELAGTLPRAGHRGPSPPRRRPSPMPGETGGCTLSTHTIGIIMNGVTGRMGTNQHLLRSIVPIIRQGGVRVDRGYRHHARTAARGEERVEARDAGRIRGPHALVH